MLSSFTTVFCKRAACPASHALLEFHRSLSTPKDADDVRRHLDSCDFCGAELQLLAWYRDDEEQASFVPMPPHLRRLAEDLLGSRTTCLRDLTELGEQREFSR